MLLSLLCSNFAMQSCEVLKASCAAMLAGAGYGAGGDDGLWGLQFSRLLVYLQSNHQRKDQAVWGSSAHITCGDAGSALCV